MVLKKNNSGPFQEIIKNDISLINENSFEQLISLNVEKFYDQQAKLYSNLQWKRTSISLYDYIFTKLHLLQLFQPKNKDEILEIGCGSGTWSKLIAEKCKNLIAIDISKNMIANAKRNITIPNISFQKADFLKIKFQKQYDKIVSIRVIEYFANKTAFLEKCFQLLKAKGKLIIITKMKPSFWGLIRNFRKFLKRISFPDNPRFTDLVWMKKISPKKIIKIMKKIGFSRIFVIPVIIRLPIFKRGNHEIPIIPKRLENGFLKFFSIFQNKILNLPNHLLTFKLLFSESYIIRGEKNSPEK